MDAPNPWFMWLDPACNWYRSLKWVARVFVGFKGTGATTPLVVGILFIVIFVVVV